ncbi:Oidioi.mRNA.OKI2018_I69.XSR.g15835.t1.cds [Oikopleura dioica]|uniref:Oidioi.mRNA.OKI2018_I69.XSR.g15835.t1.cds n=1 Tax=Oikopleura dioica TaxID=34765 RepID=A0ABN7SJ52_OIKDI|nr:Oidioi.mRNA.OKI2018_I69.XSR.g15835.t1.cds [Oikopleura dioica]
MTIGSDALNVPLIVDQQETASKFLCVNHHQLKEMSNLNSFIVSATNPVGGGMLDSNKVKSWDTLTGSQLTMLIILLPFLCIVLIVGFLRCRSKTNTRVIVRRTNNRSALNSTATEIIDLDDPFPNIDVVQMPPMRRRL